MNNDTIQFKEIVAILRRHFISCAFTVIACFVLAVGVAYLIPRKYTCKAVLNIQATYFQIPLVGDVISNSDSTEYKAQREFLLRRALSNDFLDQLGKKYVLFKYPIDNKYHPMERDALLKRIEYYAEGSNNYQISVSARTGEDAFNITKAVVDQMIATLISERLAKLTRTRSAINANLNSLKQDMAATPVEKIDSGHASTDIPESLLDEESRLNSLELRFTSDHPLVIKQRRKVERLRAETRRVKNKPPENERVGGLSASHRTLEEIYDDLLRKFNYLNIVIDMEKSTENYPYVSVIENPEIPASPVSPKKPMYAIGGVVLGLIFAVLQIVFLELRRGTFVTPVTATQILQVPFLGSLPAWTPQGRKTKALPAPPPQPGTHG